MVIEIEGQPWLEPSGSSFRGLDAYIHPATGTFDPYRYPVVHERETEDLWKCQGCGRVHKLSETLNCTSCGLPVTEKSRFVLE